LHSDNEHSTKKSHTVHKKDSHLHHNHHQQQHTPQQLQQPKEKKIILNDKIFNECKSILKPVKKALKNIDKIKESGVSEKDNSEKIKSLLEIGDLINDHLGAFNDPKKITEWRNFLWIFVAKFTPWDSERLKNLYKRFANSRDEESEEQQQKSTQYSSNKSLNSNSSSLSHRPSSSSNNNNNNEKKKPSNSEYWRGDNLDNSNYKNSNRPTPPSLLSSNFHNTNNYHRGSNDYDGGHNQFHHSRFNFRDNNSTYSPNTSFSSNHRSDHNTSNMNHSYSEHSEIGNAHHQNYYSPNDFSSRPKGNHTEPYK